MIMFTYRKTVGLLGVSSLQDGFESNIFEGGRFDGDGIGCWRRARLREMDADEEQSTSK